MKPDSSIPGLLALLALALAVLAVLLLATSCHRTEVHADGAKVDVHIHIHAEANPP